MMKFNKKKKNPNLLSFVLPLMLLASTTLSVPDRITAGSAQLWQKLPKRKCKEKKKAVLMIFFSETSPVPYITLPS